MRPCSPALPGRGLSAPTAPATERERRSWGRRAGKDAKGEIKNTEPPRKNRAATVLGTSRRPPHACLEVLHFNRRDSPSAPSKPRHTLGSNRHPHSLLVPARPCQRRRGSHGPSISARRRCRSRAGWLRGPDKLPARQTHALAPPWSNVVANSATAHFLKF